MGNALLQAGLMGSARGSFLRKDQQLLKPHLPLHQFSSDRANPDSQTPGDQLIKSVFISLYRSAVASSFFIRILIGEFSRDQPRRQSPCLTAWLFAKGQTRRWICGFLQ